MSQKTSPPEASRPYANLPESADAEARSAAAEIAEMAKQLAAVNSAPPSEASDDAHAIPMLTDVLPGGVTMPTEPDESPTTVAAADSGADDPLNLGSAEWNRMAMQVHKSVMKRMLKRTDELIDGELRDRLDEILDHSAERLMADLKSTMQQAIGEAVSRAIAEELSAARNNIKQAD